MKTILTFLLLTCLALQAQNPPANRATLAATNRDALLLRALRERMATLDPSSAAASLSAASHPPAAAQPPGISSVPGVPPPATNPPAHLPATASNVAAPLSNASVPSASVPVVAAAASAGTNAAAVPPLVLPGPSGPPALSRPAGPTAAVAPLPAAGPGAPGRPPAFPGVPGAAAAAGVAAAEQDRLAKLAGGVQPGPEDVATNIFNFPAVDLNTFLNDFYAPIVGRTILRPATLPNVTVTLRTVTALTRTEAIQAFDTVLAMNQITTIPVGEKFVKVVPTQQALQEAAPFNRLSPTNLPETAQYITYIVQLKYVKPSEVAAVLQGFAKVPSAVLPIEGSQMLVIRDFSENVKRMLEVVKAIDVAVPSEFISEVIPIKYALAEDIASALSALGTGGTTTTVGKGSGSRSGAGRSGGFGGTAGGFGGGMGGMGGGMGGMGGYGTGYGATPGMPGMQPYGATTPLGEVTPMAIGAAPGAVPGQPSFSDRLKSIIQKASGGTDKIEILGPNKIIADDRTNSLLIFASREDMKTITNIVAKLDVVLAQVIIEALIMEVTVGDQLNYGASWLQPPQTTGRFTGAGALQNAPGFQDPSGLSNPFSGGSGTNSVLGSFASGLSWFGKYGNNGNTFDLAVQAAASDNRVHVLSRPRIQTSHAVPATITIGTSQPIVTGTYSFYGGGPQSQFAYQNFGIELDVTPLINPDGLVVMDIQQQIQSINGSVNVGQGLTEPILANRSANAKVAVKSGETVMLGGFISSNTSNTRSGVPILKDIPLLGALFSSATRSHDRTELIVLIRPTVLQTPEIAAAAAKDAQDRLPFVKRAVEDEQAYRDEMLRKLDKEDKRSSKAN